ncbi:primosomal protein N' family DNA-binding protein [Gephyromycinifex aptenodytis]|uniref:primosomal protein N' family DNA-binding protein n=1 Tax=Gephyromycinifex aptenodytis TaxID=2716227 RepID=UPI001447A97D|nr:primosome assembly protein PriA [Gephyromycinifex aptenodytis]
MASNGKGSEVGVPIPAELVVVPEQTPHAAGNTLGASASLHEPVAVVVVDVPLPHLDRPFEYLVPPELDEAAAPGVRVKARFAGRDVDGFIVQRRTSPEHPGRLTALRRVVTGEAVLTPEVLRVARAVADSHAGSLGDVLRLAVPPRHATAEKALPLTAEPGEPLPPRQDPPRAWARYPAGPSFLRRMAAGEAPWAVWSASPSPDPELDWPASLAQAAQAGLQAGRGVIIVVPDHRDVERVEVALTAALGRGRHVRLTADQGPQARYTAFLKVLRDHVRCVVGTRAAAYAPVHNLGLLVCWDDGDDLHSEPRAPYAHVRDVLAIRAREAGAALLMGGFARSTAMAWWLEQGPAREILPEPAERRAVARVHVVGEGHDLERDGPGARAHLPSAAWRAAQAGLAAGPVLVQVPRRGYLPSLSCQECRAPARCPACHGPLALAGPQQPPSCRWCGAIPREFRCDQCGSPRLRSSVVGSRRTAEELGRAFPGVLVRTSGAPEVLRHVGAESALVIATPGAEPPAEGGYAATLLLDAWAGLDRPRLDAGEEALRRWLSAAALTRPASCGGVVVLAGAPQHTTLPVVEALVRWAPEWFAARELAERAELSLPPCVWMARLTGPVRAVRAAGEEVAEAVPTIERLGPLPISQDEVHLLLRAPLSQAPAATRALWAMRRGRSARKEPDQVAVRIGAADVGP